MKRSEDDSELLAIWYRTHPNDEEVEGEEEKAERSRRLEILREEEDEGEEDEGEGTLSTPSPLADAMKREEEALDRILANGRHRDEEDDFSSCIRVIDTSEAVFTPSEESLNLILWAKSCQTSPKTLGPAMSSAQQEREERQRKLREGIIRIGPM